MNDIKLFDESEMIVIDLETFDVEPSAAVFSVAGLRFDPNATDLIPVGLHPNGQFENPANIDPKRYYVMNIGMASNIEHGRTFSASTLKFWQDNIKIYKEIQDKYQTTSAETALTGLMTLVGPDDIPLLCNPPSFDFSILKSYMQAAGVQSWNHWVERCFRTVKNLAWTKNHPAMKDYKSHYETNYGPPHDPFVDCIIEGGMIQLATQHLRDLVNKTN